MAALREAAKAAHEERSLADIYPHAHTESLMAC